MNEATLRAAAAACATPTIQRFQTADHMTIEVERIRGKGIVILSAQASREMRTTLELTKADGAALGAVLRRQAEALDAEDAIAAAPMLANAGA